MDWTALISELGGGLNAVGLVALAYLYWHERKRNDALVERMLKLSDDRSNEGAQREVETASQLRKITDLLERMRDA